MNDYIAAVLFFLPAGIANIGPVIVNRIPLLNKWNTPLDFGKSLMGHRIFGNNKTWRGLVFGTLVGGISAVVISKLNANTIVTIIPFWAGALLGFGALLGDAIESFFKRQARIPSGESWFPFDQLDYIFGALVVIYPFVQIPFWAITTIFAVYFVLHLLVSYLGYKLGLKNRPI